MKKRGVTLSILMTVVLVLAILATAVVTSISTSLNNSKLSVWATEISLVQDVIKENKNKIDEILLGEIAFDTSDIPEKVLEEQFHDETILDDSIVLYEINLGKTELQNVMYGKHNSNNDVYAYSKETGKVYYLAGIAISKKDTYYTLTDDLKNRYTFQEEVEPNLSLIVFNPSTVSYTNKPISVTVNIPKTFTDIKITTSNENIAVGGQNIEENKITYEVNTNSVKGNYTIYVEYKVADAIKNAEYFVNNYDDIAPQVKSAVKILDEITLIVVDDFSGIKEIRYITSESPTENIQEYFKTNGIKVNKTKFKINMPEAPITVYVEDKAGNYAVKKAIVSMPEDWKASVREVTEDGVPIPIGFAQSPYQEENKKRKGLVIYALTETEITNGVTDITKVDDDHQDSLESRNQFVWVPVDRDNFKKAFKREDFINSTSQISNELGVHYWEVVLDSTNMPLGSTINTTNYVSAETLSEVTAMYESVKKYGGFYIARYEAGTSTVTLDNQYGYIATRVSVSDVTNSNLTVTMGKYPYTNDYAFEYTNASGKFFNGVTKLARAFYPKTSTTYGVVSTLTYGVQWDSTLNWWKELNAKMNLLDSTNYGVNLSAEILAEDLNANAKASYKIDDDDDVKLAAWDGITSKKAGECYLLTTGAYKKANVYNIYDMAGNTFEWTMEMYLSEVPVMRGGSFIYSGEDRSVDGSGNSGNTSGCSVVSRGHIGSYAADFACGFRPSLYIK